MRSPVRAFGLWAPQPVRQARHGRQGQDTQTGRAKPIRGSVAKRPGGASAQQREAISNTGELDPGRLGSGHARCSSATYAARTAAVAHRNATRTIMRPTQQEFANPREWLTRLAEESDGYRRLVRESGGTGRAAYRLARARCSVTLVGSQPCLDDLQAAAELLATRLGSGGTLPIKSLLPSARSTPASAPSSERGAASRARSRSNRISA